MICIDWDTVHTVYWIIGFTVAIIVPFWLDGK